MGRRKKGDTAIPSLNPEKPIVADPVDKFLRENAKGSLPDAPESVRDAGGDTIREVPDGGREDKVYSPEKLAAKARALSGEPDPDPEKPADAVTTPAAEPLAPVEAGKPATAEAAKPADAQPATPPAAAAPAELAAPAQPAAKAPIDYEQMVRLDDDTEWKLGDVVAGLRERESFRPIAKELGSYRALFGGKNFAEAEAEWKPIIEKLRTEPTRRMLADLALKADPSVVQYLLDSRDFWDQLPQAERDAMIAARPAPAAAAAAPAERGGIPVPAAAPQDETTTMLLEQAVNQRAKNDWDAAYERYSFLRANQKARQVLSTAAMRYHNEDLGKKIHPLKARGLLEALKDEQIFLETMQTAYEAQERARQPADVEPGKGPEALLTSAAPEPPGARAAAKRPEEYRGKLDDSVAAFIADYPQ